MKNRDKVNIAVLILGVFIMVVFVNLATNDPEQGEDMLFALRLTIIGAAMFISGYIGLNIRDK